MIYKIISKLLATHLSGVLPEIILHHKEFLFVNKRLMAHNIYLCQELMLQYGRTYMSPRCTTKASLQKAYDFIEWHLLRDMLQQLKFHEKFIDWVMICVETPLYSIQYNGSLHDFFSGKRGLRQGDPFSHLL